MVVLLTILKVIGIILLVLLGLILLILLLVLFAPIRYNIAGNYYESATWVKGSVRFLVIKALAGFDKDDGLDYKVQVLGFQVYPRKEKESERS